MDNNWIKLSDQTPRIGQCVITWGTDGMRVCRYEDRLTWKGWKPRFTNMLGKGLIWDDKVTHWMALPNSPSL